MQAFKNRLFIFSFGLGLASSVAIFQPNTTIKDIGKGLLGFSIAGVVLGELATAQSYNDTSKFDSAMSQKDKENSDTVRKLDKTLSELSTIKKQSEKLESELQQANETIQSRGYAVVQANQSIDDLKNKLRDVGRFSTAQAYEMVRETYKRSVKKLEAHIDALMRNYAPVADDFNDLLIEVDKFRNRYMKKLEEYEELTSFNELIDVGLDMQEKIINGCIELRVKGQTIAIRYLNSLLEDSVSYQQYENDVVNLQNHAGLTIQQLKDQTEAQVRAIATDWLNSNDQHLEVYQAGYQELVELKNESIALLQKRDTLIGDLQLQVISLKDKITELSKPWTFAGTIDYAVAGNAIINFYSGYGYTLDAMGWQETETGYTLTFATGRNKVYLTADMLHDKDNQPQLAGLTNALQLPVFTPNYQSGLMTLEVVTRKPVKKQTNEKDVSKLWKSVDKFEDIVKGWSRVRITGGSESGKSPTAENIAVCILKHRPGTAKLFNPQHDSIKNYWTIPVVGTSHKDSEKAIATLAKQVDARSNGQESREDFELSIFDEIDSTMSHTKGKKSAIGGDVNFIIKQASHQNLGAIFIGQNANVSEYPGMDRSDWNSAVNVHIGNNANDALTNTNLLTTSETEKLKEVAAKLTEFCNQKNDELGLDSKTDIEAYRFALVMESGKRPYFIELPSYGRYTYDSVESSTVQILSADAGRTLAERRQNAEERGSNPDYSVAEILAETGYVGSVCPKCKTGILSLSSPIRGVQYYHCSHCGKKSSGNILSKNQG
jgi:hypothetical protein